MSHRIMQALTHDTVRRLRNWAQWANRGGEAQISPSSMWSAGGSDGYRESTMPLLEGEADDTDKALKILPIRYGQAVRRYWQNEEAPLSVSCKFCACDYRTYENRVIQGHVLVVSEIYRMSDFYRERRSIYSKMRNGGDQTLENYVARNQL